jgi:hypothetical protein
MHPEILRELSAQHGNDMRARAHQAGLARLAIRARRRRRAQLNKVDGFTLPAIPDYVDGSFRTESAGDKAASEAGHAPVSHRAA